LSVRRIAAEKWGVGSLVISRQTVRRLGTSPEVVGFQTAAVIGSLLLARLEAVRGATTSGPVVSTAFGTMDVAVGKRRTTCVSCRNVPDPNLLRRFQLGAHLLHLIAVFRRRNPSRAILGTLLMARGLGAARQT
jgi:hypothetical protein